jgi:FkbM family methyltransferase
MNKQSSVLILTAPTRTPFQCTSLPLIAKLTRLGFHQYRNRWAKRLGKRAGRLVFDAAYGMGLGGDGVAELAINDGPARLRFDARKRHYASLYLDHYGDGYEAEVALLLETFLKPDAVFYDIGSNWGYFAFYAAAKPGYTGAVHAFEPVAGTYADLTDWVAQSGLARITCHQLALSDKAGSGVMILANETTGLARLGAGMGDAGGGGGETVTLARFDDLDLPPPDVMKIDVEEHELQVLQGAKTVLGQQKPMLIFENWLAPGTPETTLAPLKFLQAEGYVLYQPLWRLAGGSLAWPGTHAPLPPGDHALALAPFAAEARFDLRDQVNVFACHRDRLGELDAVFEAG